ncbi:phage holin family protein [Kaistella flava (ex Peng et al. 2021)]|uniref:Phage holin family protein n=1 Tax=Kaistella flava (ex Peng et al. 2021) TaxID=2038776 RepID=A0A7M2Y823_9FLAO|nr:hypothetical protein [Kaistella flava (ex Peng et al. 2021)]QOW10301.1 phage holin family protein [Kaistella flava (ex Peng et al. 2021)]
MKIEETAIDHIRSRPRFKIFTEISRDEYAIYLKRFLQKNSAEFEGNVNKEISIITVRTEGNHYWNPCLALRTEIDPEENKTVIRGIFGPTSAVWTFFMFLNFIFGIMWMVAITIWYVEKQIKSHDFPWAFSFSIIMLVCLALTFMAARIGRLKGKKQMQKLRAFAEESIRNFEKN